MGESELSSSAISFLPVGHRVRSGFPVGTMSVSPTHICVVLLHAVAVCQPAGYLLGDFSV